MLNQATKFAPQPASFRLACESGFRCAELWTSVELLDDWEHVAATARAFPLKYALHAPNRGDLDADRARGLIGLARALHASAVVVHPPMFKRFGETLWAIDDELPLAVENGRLDARQFEDWAERYRWLTLDVEHYWTFTLADAPLPEVLDGVGRFLDERLDKLRHVHLPGYVPGWKTHRPMYCSRDFVLGVFDLLSDHGFEGLIVSEVDEPFQNGQELRMDRLLFEHWLETRTGTATATRVEPVIAAK